MKKIFLYLFAVSLALSSCSKDDSTSNTLKKISMTIGGQVKTFNTISVTEEVYEVGTEDEYTDLVILASNGTETISIGLAKEETGTDVIYYFSYVDSNDDDYYNTDSFNTNVTVNSSSKNLKGTFSGILQGSEMGTTINVTKGSFNIKY